MSAMAGPLEVSESADATPCAELWLYRMMETPYPLLEKMTLFWHGYFAVAASRVGRAGLVERHVRLLRRHALGRFDALLGEVCRDPATLMALGAGAGRVLKPPADFAATLLRRYTLGPGVAGEDDVRDTARAFTGAYVLRGEYRYLPHEHDSRAGSLRGEDVVARLLAHPATPRWVVRCLYGWLVSETAEPGDALLEPLAASFAKDYDLARLVATVLRSNLFYSPEAYRQRVKSPVEFALGLALACGATVPPAPLYQYLARLGQRLLEPPTREGWPGGRSWLNRFTLVGRSNLAAAMLAPQGEFGGRLHPPAEHLAELLVQSDAAGDALTIAALPEFQLA